MPKEEKEKMTNTLTRLKSIRERVEKERKARTQSAAYPELKFLLDLIDGYQKMWEITSKRVFPGEVDSGDALIQVFNEQSATIDKQARALEIAREELDGRFCFCEENICTRCKALTAIDDEVLK